ncbi:glutathione peroxidase [Lodderomyces elongisporus NRRL YB-4239]|uniref:Glutathione peroxidase n=1 Tax=Lodderomyces elongisporus (strain ATCC 11503 / CBS 2605 / JCM 1781 / NBRC 1676 / NRRL YB-4239) TaxID=379508 RepID=A5E4Z2_LODEL|nr:glutathione peroxidase [Lodderomyces elongisporus NRRL YB-4239]
MSKFYQLKAKLPNGEEYSFEQLKGKVVLIINVASKCGFTPQYAGLEELNQKFAKENVQLLGFPCNQFGNQEPGTAEEIALFCSTKYNVTFPVMAKVNVNGDNTCEVYQYLKLQKKALGLSRIKWNFEKFLIDQEGNVVERFSSLTKPADIAPKIEQLLKK